MCPIQEIKNHIILSTFNFGTFLQYYLVQVLMQNYVLGVECSNNLMRVVNEDPKPFNRN